MKNFILKSMILMIVLFFSTECYSQFKIKKPKIKKPKILNTKPSKNVPSTKGSSTSGSSSSSSSPLSAAQSPEKKKQVEAEAALDVVKEIYDDKETLYATSISDMSNKLNLFKSKLSSYKGFTTPDNEDYVKLTEELTKYEGLKENELARRRIVDKLPQKLNFWSNQIEASIAKKEDVRITEFKYSEYAAMKEAFDGLRDVEKTPERKQQLATLTDYIDDYIPNTFVPYYKNSLKEKYDYNFDEKEWKESPHTVIGSLDQSIKVSYDYNNKFALFMNPKDHKLIDEINNVLIDQNKIVKEYVSSGAYEKHNAKKSEELANATYPSKPYGNDAVVNSTVRKNYNSGKFGTIIKIIKVNSWAVSKNGFGIPLEKYCNVEVISKKKNGLCYMNKATVFKPYTGGGTYGSPDLFMDYSVRMNCANVK